MRLLVPDGARRQRLLQCEAHLPLPPASPPPPALASPAPAAAGGRTVVVGIRRDAASRELLTWALVKINLELKVCGGSSIRKSLVKEAASCGAAHLILGVAQNSRSFGSSSTSVAKYCSKRVPVGCSVLAVNNGKVVYHKDGGHGMQHELYQSTIPETPRRSYRKLLSSMIGEKLWDEHGKDSRSISRAVTMPMRPPPSSMPMRSPARSKEASLALVPVKACRRESAEVATGWPLLRKKFLPDWKASLPDKSKMSVVQWAMRHCCCGEHVFLPIDLGPVRSRGGHSGGGIWSGRRRILVHGARRASLWHSSIRVLNRLYIFGHPDLNQVFNCSSLQFSSPFVLLLQIARTSALCTLQAVEGQMAFGSKKRKEAEMEHEAPEHIDSGDEVHPMETDEGGEEETAVQNPTKTQLLLDQVTILSSGKGKNPGGSKSWQCKHCKKTFSSTLTRIGMHFFGAGAGKKAQISRCQALQTNRAKYK